VDVTTSAQERDFFDLHYSQFLKLPDHALRVDREILESTLDDPAHPSYERRGLLRAAMQAVEAQPLRDATVLDYGCGPGEFGLWMATEGAFVTLLDLSPAAIELGLRRARASGVEVRGVAADASRLDMLADATYDLVFASAALHHTMKYPGAIEELARVMKPGARLVLCETWGANPVLGLARQLRARLSREPEEQGEEIVMSWKVLRQLDPYFCEIEAEQRNLLAMGKRLLRGRFEKPWARLTVRTLETVDSALLTITPPLRNWCGEAIITARRR
jgi:ubiquinone/menaquinone biosynthesis C-methylase UbiE